MLDATQVYERLQRFDLEPDVAKKCWLLKGERLTPDSAAYLVMSSTTEQFFVLYIEDFIDNLSYIKETVEKWYESKIVRFVEPKVVQKFDEFPGARYYMQPNEKKISKWIKYAIDDGGEFGFLLEIKPAKTNESFWAQTRMNQPKKVDPKVQKQIDELMKQHLPPDPFENFLTSWKKKTGKE